MEGMNAIVLSFVAGMLAVMFCTRRHVAWFPAQMVVGVEYYGPSAALGFLCAAVYWGHASPWWLLTAPAFVIRTASRKEAP